MPQPTSLRRRRGRSFRVATAACLACLGGTAAIVLLSPRAVASSAAPAPAMAAANACLLFCTPTPAPHSATPAPTHSSTPRPTPPPSNPPPPPPQPPPPPPSSGPPPIYVPPPQQTVLPTLPPPTPGAPPQPPVLEVQTIQLDLASDPATQPGAQVFVQATTEAQRGTDTYAVPHAALTFSIGAQSGAGAFVDPAQVDSGDTGVVVITVQTGDEPGDTVVHAISGGAAADFTVHADPAAPSPTPARTAKPQVVATLNTNSHAGPKPLTIAALSALLAAIASGYAAALILGRLHRPLHRRAWGRRQAR